MTRAAARDRHADLLSVTKPQKARLAVPYLSPTVREFMDRWSNARDRNPGRSHLSQRSSLACGTWTWRHLPVCVASPNAGAPSGHCRGLGRAEVCAGTQSLQATSSSSTHPGNCNSACSRAPQASVRKNA